MTTSSQFTCVVATENRPAMLRRLLRYLSEVRFPWRVFVADSSRPGVRDENLSSVSRVAGVLDVGWLAVDAPFLTKCTRMLNRAASPYAAICGDDEFLMPATVQRSVEFLDQHPDFVSSMGITVTVHKHRGGRCYALPGRGIVNDSPVVRSRSLAGNWFSTFPGVYRTPDLRRIIKTVEQNTDSLGDSIFSQLLLSHLTVMSGRFCFLPTVQSLCQNSDRIHCRRVTCPDQRMQLYERFQERLVEQLEVSGAARAHACKMTSRWYGYLRTDSDAAMKPSRTICQKVRREIVRHHRRVLNLVSSDSILERRRLHIADLQGCENDWKLAHQMMVEFPDGIPLEPARESDDWISAAA